MNQPKPLTDAERHRKRPWDTFMPCPDRATCEHNYHVKAARKKFREAIKLDLYGFAERLHDARCDMWAHRHHGGSYIQKANDACGPERHITHIANLPWVKEVYELHHTGSSESTKEAGAQ